MKCTLIIPCLGVLLVGCSAFRPNRAEMAEDLVPETFSRAMVNTNAVSCWWKDFNRADLNALQEKAFTQNLDLEQAAARLRQAHMSAKIAGSDYIPTLNATAEAETDYDHYEASGTDADESFSLGLSASYELDLWGRVYSNRRAAQLSWKASQQDYRTSLISLSAEVTEYWLQLLEQQSQLDLLSQQLTDNETSLELLKMRRRRALASALDVYQQEQLVAATQTLIPQTEQQVMILRHGLAVLLGQPPKTELGLTYDGLPDLRALPSIGIPAEVLAQRPDVQAAQLRLESADFTVSAAQADRLPAISLSATGYYSSDDIDSLFDNWFANLAANLVGPLIDGGSRRSEVKRATARADELLASYRQTVLEALREVEDALIREEKIGAVLVANERELDVARRTLEEADDRYRKGVNDYLSVLSARTVVQQKERAALSVKRELLSNRVSLYRALGGSWTESVTHF